MDAALGGIDNHGRDTPVPLTNILAERGLDDTLWALCAIGAVRVQRLFAADCAERVLHLFEAACPGDLRPREAIRVARLYARGLASYGELDAARAAAWAAAWAAARGQDAAWAASWAATRGQDAAWAAAWAAAHDAAWDAWAAAQAAARAAAWDAARAATHDAASDAYDAASDAYDAASDAERAWQTARLRELIDQEET
jgi:hypothetical protein